MCLEVEEYKFIANVVVITMIGMQMGQSLSVNLICVFAEMLRGAYCGSLLDGMEEMWHGFGTPKDSARLQHVHKNL